MYFVIVISDDIHPTPGWNDGETQLEQKLSDVDVPQNFNAIKIGNDEESEASIPSNQVKTILLVCSVMFVVELLQIYQLISSRCVTDGGMGSGMDICKVGFKL